jgi:hypothetical protein
MIDYTRLRQIARSTTKWESVRPEDVRTLLESHRLLLSYVKELEAGSEEMIKQAEKYHE